MLDDLRRSDVIDVTHGQLGAIGASHDDAAAVFDILPGWEGVVLDPGLRNGALRFTDISGSWRTADSLPHLGGEFSGEFPEHDYSSLTARLEARL